MPESEEILERMMSHLTSEAKTEILTSFVKEKVFEKTI